LEDAMTRFHIHRHCGLPVLAASLRLLLPGLLSAQWTVPEIPFDSAPNFLKLTDKTPLGEAVGVATDSKKNIYVYTRTGSSFVSEGTSRAFESDGSRLFEFDQNGNFVREMGHNVYGFTFAHAVRVDSEDTTQYLNVGAPWAICISPGAHQYLFSSNSNDTGDMENGRNLQDGAQWENYREIRNGGKTSEGIRVNT
jgi:hypothetical protein